MRVARNFIRGGEGIWGGGAGSDVTTPNKCVFTLVNEIIYVFYEELIGQYKDQKIKSHSQIIARRL